MNKWKIAFLTLVGVILLLIVAGAYLMVSPTDNEQLTTQPNDLPNQSMLNVQTTTQEFEAIAKKYLSDAIADSPIDVQIEVEDQIYLFSNLVIFGVELPIQMDFDPVVDNGNIKMKQTEVHVGKLNIPPNMVLKLLKDSVDFPSWIIVNPNKEEIYVDLAQLNIANGNRVRAEEINLKENVIRLQLIVPTK